MSNVVSDAIADVLKDLGAEYFFLLTGGDQPLWISLHRAGIRMVLTRSEFSGVYMADGYARASGKPGFTYGQAGPGAANVAAALADPFWAQSPVVALTGATATSATYRGEYQALEQMPLFAPVTRWSGFAGSPDQVAGLLMLATTQAMSGPGGPTHLDVPKDFFDREVAPRARPAASAGAASPAHPDIGGVDEILDRLTAASKPLILAGEGVVRADAAGLLQSFAEALHLPVATTMGGKTGLPGDHPLNVGIVGRYSAKVANEVLAESDCVLVVGSRLGGLATNGYTVPNRSATMLQIDSDPGVFDLTYPAAVRLVADARLALHELVERAKGCSLSADATAWTQGVGQRVGVWRQAVSAATNEAASNAVLSPLQVFATLARYNQEITVVADTGYMAAWTGVLYPTARPGSYFRAAGSLGWALPASLGVQLARTEKVVCVTGDGGLGYHLSDIETAARMRLPVVVVILNNRCLAFEYHEQKYRHQGQVVAEVNDLSDADYAAAARALGAEGTRVTTAEEFDQAFKAALDHDGPTVLDVQVDREAYPPVTNFDRAFDRKI